MNDQELDLSALKTLLDDIRGADDDEHFPEEILRAYFGQDVDFEEEIEEHLLVCTACREIADRILAETSPWKDEDPARIEELKSEVLSRLPYRLRLRSALERLVEGARGELQAALVAWNKQMVDGYLAVEATLQAKLAGLGELTLVPEFSSRGIKLDYATGGTTLKGSGQTDKSVDTSSVIVSTDLIEAAQVRIEPDSSSNQYLVEVTFLDWNGAEPPLVLLVPDSETGQAQALLAIEDSDTGVLGGRFRVEGGSFWLTIASPE